MTGSLQRGGILLVDVTRAWTVRTLRARYQQAALGWLWAVIQPLATVAIFTVVFTRFVRVDTGDVPYVVFSYTAVAPWTLLASALPDMAGSLVANLNLVTKIYFPREALPLAAFAARAADFAVSAVLLLALLLVYGMTPSWLWLVYLPVVFVVQSVLIVGLGLGAAALNVRYRDVDPVLKLGIQVWFYASPVLYPVALVPQEWHWLYFANPMAGIIESYRDVLLSHRAPGWDLASAAILSLAAFAVGYGFFKRSEAQFADII
jgi:lipopolysaccharide transport system permease protein